MVRTARFASPLTMPWHHDLPPVEAHARTATPSGEPVEFTFTEDAHWNHHAADDILAGIGRWHVHRPNGSDSLTASAIRAAMIHAMMTSWR